MGKLSLELQKGGSDRSTEVAAQKAVTKSSFPSNSFQFIIFLRYYDFHIP